MQWFYTKLSLCHNIVLITAHFCTIISSATPSCNSKGPQNGLRYGWQSIPDVPNFLTRKCPSASQKRHFLKQTEIFRPIWNDCLRHLMIFCGPFCCSKVLHYIWKHVPERMADKAISEVERMAKRRSLPSRLIFQLSSLIRVERRRFVFRSNEAPGFKYKKVPCRNSCRGHIV